MSRPAPTRSPHILVVDDDPRIQQMLSRYLTEEGCRVTTAVDGRDMRDKLALGTPDVILIDLVMPGESGLDLVREIRDSGRQVGIIMVTGRADTIDRVVGLELGADDYIAKPFHLREVLARIKSVLRRMQPGESGQPERQDVVRFDGWNMDMGRRTLTSPKGEAVDLTTGEFELLRVFVHNAGRVLDRDRLMDLTRGRDYAAFDRAIDAQVSRLRRRIEDDPRRPSLIKSVRGVGYMLTAHVERGSAGR